MKVSIAVDCSFFFLSIFTFDFWIHTYITYMYQKTWSCTYVHYFLSKFDADWLLVRNFPYIAVKSSPHSAWCRCWVMTFIYERMNGWFGYLAALWSDWSIVFRLQGRRVKYVDKVEVFPAEFYIGCSGSSK